MKNNKPAFTLIELLVVIAIIGILATISVIALSNARAKSRDAKRAGDMKQVQTALELFFNDNNRYPTVEEWATGRIGSAVSGVTSTYMQIIPTAPTPADGNCEDGQNTIGYTPSEDGTSYSISFCLGNTTGSLTPGAKCLTPGGIIDVDCSAAAVTTGCANHPPVIGDACQGGIVFYTTTTPENIAYVSASADIDGGTGAQWGWTLPWSYILTGASGTAIGTGQENTNEILHIGVVCTSDSIAAKLCDDYVVGIYNDWFLPSIDELHEMYSQKDIIGGFADYYYWSSSEINDSYAQHQNLGDGSSDDPAKDGYYRVRPIRFFNF